MTGSAFAVVRGAGRVAVTAGRRRSSSPAQAGAPFTHFALLAPGNRFHDALAWLRERVDLLPDPDTGEPVFDFDKLGRAGLLLRGPGRQHRGADRPPRGGGV